MPHRSIAAFLAVAILVLSAGTASAFNGQRKGFLLGVGFGGGYSSFKQELSGALAGSGSESKAGVATEFKIGGGVSDQFTLYYSNKVNWFSITNASNNSVTITDGVSSLAGSYFFKPDWPSAYITAGIGAASWSTPFEEDTSGLVGLGMFTGGGYEFTRLLGVEGTLGYGQPSKTELGVKLTTKSAAFRVHLNLTWY